MKTKKAGFIAAFLAIAVAVGAAAYTLKSFRWPYARTTYDTSPLPSSWRDGIDYAASRWTNTGYFRFSHSTSSPNKLYRTYLDGKYDRLATTSYSTTGNFIYRTKVEFDSGESWHTESTTPSSSRLDLRSVATHELGHVLGLYHPSKTLCTSSVPKSSRPTMCQAGDASDANYNDTHRRSLETDDKNGVKAQYYGVPQVAPPPSEIQSEVCVISDWFILDDEDRARETDTLLVGRVVAVGPTLWNSDDGEYWDDPSAPVAPLPYHEVEILTEDALYQKKSDSRDYLGTTTVVVPEMSPVDSANCLEENKSFVVGDRVVLFLAEKEMAFRDGTFLTKLQTVTQPSASFLVEGSDGLFRAADTTVSEEGMTLEDITQATYDWKGLTQPTY